MSLIDQAAWVIAAFLVGIGKLLDAGGHFIEVLAGVAVAVFTFYLARIAGRADGHFRVTERAYITMSHKAPGVDWNDPIGGDFVVTIQIKNFGNTPAQVTDAFLDAKMLRDGDVISEDPIYAIHRPGRLPETAFLVTGSDFNLRQPFKFTRTEREIIEEGNKAILLVYGYVDYIDKFGDHHRGGYARMYDPAIDRAEYATPELRKARNNLPIFPHRRYNYDDSRERGIGNDWES